MDHFHLADRPPVAEAIAAAAACDTLDQLYSAISEYKGHDVARSEHYTPSWPVTRPTGNPAGPLMIVSERPEPTDAEKGAPFTGSYGSVMREVLGWYGVDLDQVHVTYAVHWSLGAEKTPNSTQISASRPFIFREIEIVKPRAILVPGARVLEALFMYREPITPMLGMTMDRKRGDLRVPAFISWHPAWPTRFKSDIVTFGDQIQDFLLRFGMPDGSMVKPRFGKAA